MEKFAQYIKFECYGFWRETPDDPGRRVVAQLGDSFLTLISPDDRVLAHWAIAAVWRINQGEWPAKFSPDKFGNETIEINDADAVSALNELVVGELPDPSEELSNPWFGKMIAVLILLAVCGGIYYNSEEIAGHMAGFISASKRTEIGEVMFSHLAASSGPRCQTLSGDRALAALESELFEERADVRIIRAESSVLPFLPGRIAALPSSLFSVHDDVSVIAGYLLALELHATNTDSMTDLLKFLGLGATVRLVLREEIDEARLREYAGSLTPINPSELDQKALLQLFQAAGISSAPFADATGIGGVLAFGGLSNGREHSAILSDGQWMNLKGICFNLF